MVTIKKKVYFPRLRELVAGHKDPAIRGMRQEDIADRVDTSRQTIIRWYKSDEPFDSPPYTPVALKLATMLGLGIVDNLWSEGYIEVDVPEDPVAPGSRALQSIGTH